MASESKTKMSYVNLGKSGLKVSKLILGVMTYGSGQDWMIPDHEEGIRQMKYAYDQGINTFDTANTYSAGESEIILGKFLKKHEIPRESVVILTKTFNPDDSDGGPAGLVNQKGLSRKRIFASVKRSLERLQLDYVDVLQCHRFDYDTPIEETMQALHDLVQQGLVHYIGMSSCWAWQMQLMQQYAINNRLTPFISMQNQHSAMYREEEREMMPMLKHFGVGVIPWGPMGGGLLCRPFQEMDSTTRARSRPQDGRGHQVGSPLFPRSFLSWSKSQLTSQPGDKLVINAIEKIANDRQVPMAAVALAWSLQSPWVTAPIVGVRSTERLDELIGALELKLTDEERKSIDDGYSPVKPRSFQ